MLNGNLRLPVIALLVVWLSACGVGGGYFLSPQQWGETQFVVEVRPGPPVKGMNEFVIIATDVNGTPGYQYVISIKTDSGGRWRQMIQDGHSGVYRRAIPVSDPSNGVLSVEIKHQKEKAKQTILTFPLSKTSQ